MSKIQELASYPVWANQTSYSADASGNPWRTGSAPTKVQPTLYAEGFVPNDPLAAEHMNFLLNQQEQRFKQLAFDRMLRCDYATDSYPDNLRGVPVYDSLRHCWVGSALGVHYLDRSFSQMRLGASTLTSGTGSEKCCTGKHAPTGRIVFVFTTGSSYYILNTDDSVSTSTTLTGFSIAVLCRPTMSGSNLLFAGYNGSSYLNILRFNGTNFSTSALPVNVTYSSTEEYRFIVVGSRVYFTTSGKSFYSDNNGASWVACAGSTAIVSGVAYDADNVRFLRFENRSLDCTVHATSGTDPNGSVTTLKTIKNLSLSRVQRFGKYLVALGVRYPNSDAAKYYACVAVSPDNGLSWALGRIVLNNATMLDIYTDQIEIECGDDGYVLWVPTSSHDRSSYTFCRPIGNVDTAIT